MYKYFTFALAFGGQSPPDSLPVLYCWTTLGDLHPPDPLARPPFAKYLDPRVNPSIVKSWPYLWLVQISHIEL